MLTYDEQYARHVALRENLLAHADRAHAAVLLAADAGDANELRRCRRAEDELRRAASEQHLRALHVAWCREQVGVAA